VIELRAGNARILRGAIEPIEATIIVDGKETDAQSTPTVTITRADGTAIATGAATTKPSGTTGLYRYTPVAGDVADVDVLTAVWTVTMTGPVVHTLRTRHEIVGGYYVDLAELREVGEIPEKILDARLVRVRRAFEDLAEDFCGTAFVPRYARDLFSPDGESRAVLLRRFPVRQLLRVAIDGTAQTLSDFGVTRAGALTRDAGYFPRGDSNVAVAYEHGFDAPSEELREAAITYASVKILGNDAAIPERALSMETPGGTFGLSIAGENRPTGIPSVDAVLLKLRNEAPVVG
jgi:hypothetical protein